MSMINSMFFPNRKRPKVVWEFEGENSAWIDFFWSTVGRSGDVGQDIGLFYAKLQDKQQVEKLIANFSTSWLEQTNQPKWVEGIEARGVEWLLDFVFNRLPSFEKNRTDQVLSPDAQNGLQWYMEGPLLEEIRIENKQRIPPDITFLFGHTHKPFQQEMNFAGYPDLLNVYTIRHWFVYTLLLSPFHVSP